MEQWVCTKDSSEELFAQVKSLWKNQKIFVCPDVPVRVFRGKNSRLVVPVLVILPFVKRGEYLPKPPMEYLPKTPMES